MYKISLPGCNSCLVRLTCTTTKQISFAVHYSCGMFSLFDILKYVFSPEQADRDVQGKFKLLYMLSAKKALSRLNKLPLNLVFDGDDLAIQLGVTRGDASSNDRARNVAGTSESSFRRDKDIRNVLPILVNNTIL